MVIRLHANASSSESHYNSMVMVTGRETAVSEQVTEANLHQRFYREAWTVSNVVVAGRGRVSISVMLSSIRAFLQVPHEEKSPQEQCGDVFETDSHQGRDRSRMRRVRSYRLLSSRRCPPLRASTARARFPTAEPPAKYTGIIKSGMPPNSGCE